MRRTAVGIAMTMMRAWVLTAGAGRLQCAGLVSSSTIGRVGCERIGVLQTVMMPVVAVTAAGVAFAHTEHWVRIVESCTGIYRNIPEQLFILFMTLF